MQFNIQRELLLKSLQQVVSVVEKRQTLPVLANLLVRVHQGQLSLTATDLEVEMVATILVEDSEDGETTIPAKKCFDIVRALPDGVRVQLKLNGDRISLSAGRSRFTLATLPALEFPSIDNIDLTEKVALPEQALRELMERTAFAMAHQDVRFYLNGMLLEIQENYLRCVATDGHRLALKEIELNNAVKSRRQIIIPSKGVNELIGLLASGDEQVELEFGRNHLRVRRGEYLFTSKLIDGRFPDYDAVIPLGADKEAKLDREVFRNALQRVAILSNEKYRGVKLEFFPGKLRIIAHNPEQEEATEEVEAETSLDQLMVGFNVNYLMDALNALRDDQIRLNLRDAQSSCLLQEREGIASRHVVMPLRI